MTEIQQFRQKSNQPQAGYCQLGASASHGRDQIHFLVLKLVEGDTLADRLAVLHRAAIRISQRTAAAAIAPPAPGRFTSISCE